MPISREVQETRLERVQNVNYQQSVLDRMLGVGTVDFDTAGTDDSEFRFEWVDGPEEVVLETVGFQHSPREKIFEAVIDSVEVKQARDLSPRDIEHDNPEFRRLDEMVHFLEQIYGRKVEMEDTVTVVRFSQVSDRPSESRDRLRPAGPHQN